MESNRKILTDAIDSLIAAAITITDHKVIVALEAIQAELEDLKQEIRDYSAPTI